MYALVASVNVDWWLLIVACVAAAFAGSLSFIGYLYKRHHNRKMALATKIATLEREISHICARVWRLENDHEQRHGSLKPLEFHDGAKIL
jgi:hypothetical protein